MDILDDVDERLRQAARPSQAAVDRIKRAAVAGVAPPPVIRALPVAALIVCLLAAGVWWSRRPTASAMTVTWESPGDGMSVQASDGTTWIFGGRAAPDYLPPGTCVVIAEGGTQ